MTARRRRPSTSPRATFRRRTCVFLALFAAPPAILSPVHAQEPVVEEQVALDADGRLLRIDADLAAALGLFGDLTNVREVLLFRSADGYVLEITRRRAGVLVRERRPLAEDEVAELRAAVTRRLAERAPSALVDRSGRYLLLGTSTAAGLGLYGWAVPYALGVDDTKGQVALYMLISAASFFGPWLWSEDQPVSLGMANGAFWGATRGIVHGIGLHRVIAGEEPEFGTCLPDDFACFERTDEERDAWQRGRVASMLAGSVVEGIGALAWARSARATAGDAHLVGVSSDLGAGGAVALGVALGLEDDAAALWGLTLAGAATGIGGGVLHRARRDYSWGDAEVFRTTALLGAYAGVAMAEIGGATGPRPHAGLGLAGGTLGLFVGDRLVRGRDITAGQGLLVDLGTVAGGLLGLGVAVLVADDAAVDGRLHMALSALGAGLGFGATFATLPDPRPGDRFDRGPGADGSSGRLDLEIVPFPAGATRVGAGSFGSSPPIALRARYRW